MGSEDLDNDVDRRVLEARKGPSLINMAAETGDVPFFATFSGVTFSSRPHRALMRDKRAPRL